MLLGLWIQPLHQPDQPLAAVLAEATEKALWAEEVGFDEVWVGEHLSSSAQAIASPVIFLAGLAPQTRRVRLGTAAINVAYRHPVIVAAEVAQLDHASGGRALLGIGAGSLISDHEIFGLDDGAVRARMVAEAGRMIESLWTQEPPWRLDGEFWSSKLERWILPDLGIGSRIRPLQVPGPPIFLTVASEHSGAAAIASQRGWGMLSGNSVPVAWLAAHWRNYQAAALPGTASASRWRVARNVLVAPTDREAQFRVECEEGANFRYFAYLERAQRALGMPEPSPAAAVVGELVIAGSPHSVTDRLIGLVDEIGPWGGLLVTATSWSGPNREWERESMRLLATRVLPRVREHLRSLER